MAVIVLAALPHLNAALNLDALLKQLATLHGSEDQPSSPYGISTIGCPQDMLQLNPVLSDLQTYGSRFGIVVDCTASSEICSDLRISTEGKTFHSRVCSEPHQSQGLFMFVSK